MVNKRFRSSIRDSITIFKTYPGADCYTDHNPVIANMKVKLKNPDTTKPSPKLDYELLAKDEQLQRLYKITVENKFDVLANIEEDNEDPNTVWQTFRSCLVEAADETIPRRQRKHQKWMTDEILELMEERRLMKGKNIPRYKEMHQRVKEKCREAKEKWWNDQCAELERVPATAHTKMKLMVNKGTSCSSSGCIKAKNGDILMEKEKILERWSEYIEDLFCDNRGERPLIRKDMNGPDIGI